MRTRYLQNVLFTLGVIAVWIVVGLAFGRRRPTIGSLSVGIFWLIAAAAIVFGPTARVRTRVAAIVFIAFIATLVSQAVERFQMLRFAFDGSLPWTDYVATSLFTFAVEILNIISVLGVAWLLASLTRRVTHTGQEPRSTESAGPNSP